MTSFRIRQATGEDPAWIEASFPEMGGPKPQGYFTRLIELQDAGALVFLIAETPQGEYAGHLKLVWMPDYPYFREQAIPEIQDLNVLPRFRRRGLASQLMEVAERLASQKSSQVGIGFGLYADYGPAQRLYVKRGYVPDGRGIAYRERTVAPGESIIVDDCLVLFLTKDLLGLPREGSGNLSPLG